jgi:hypothetical protein
MSFQEKKWDFSQGKVPLLGCWLPVVDELRTFTGVAEETGTIFDNEKGHTLFGYGLESLAPRAYSQQNFFSYNFGFFMVPIKRNHPRTGYLFHRI